MSFKFDRGPIFQVTNLNRNLTRLRPSEIHCQPDPTERNCSLRHVTTENVFNSPKKVDFSSNWPSFNFLSLKSPQENQCVIAYYWSNNVRNNVLIGLPDF